MPREIFPWKVGERGVRNEEAKLSTLPRARGPRFVFPHGFAVKGADGVIRAMKECGSTTRGRSWSPHPGCQAGTTWPVYPPVLVRRPVPWFFGPEMAR